MKSLRVGIATLVLILAGGIASTNAAPATVARNAAIHATPGGAVIVNAPAGEWLDANCPGTGWCSVDYSGIAGYMRQADLSFSDEMRILPWPDPQPWPKPVPLPEPTFPDDDDYEEAGACFYSERNLRGSSFCLEEGESLNSFRTWDNRIRSVEVFGGAEVDLCSDRNLYGSCVTLRSDTSRLPRELDRRASSVEVY